MKLLLKISIFSKGVQNLGFVKLSQGNYQQASVRFSKSISLGEGDGVTYVALGYCYYMQGQYVSAENAYRMAILLSPESKDALNGLVNCLNETDRFSEALALLDEILIKEPENVLCHRARVATLQGLGEKKTPPLHSKQLKDLVN